MLKHLKPYAGPAGWIFLQATATHFKWVENPMLIGILFGIAIFWLCAVLLSHDNLTRAAPWLVGWFPFIGALAWRSRFTDPESFGGTYFRGRNLRILDAAANGAVIGKTFEDCEIHGPAIIVAGSAINILQECHIHSATGRPVFFPIGDGTYTIPDGVIETKDCIFRRCHFYGVGFVAPPQQLEDMAKQADAGAAKFTSRGGEFATTPTATGEASSSPSAPT